MDGLVTDHAAIADLYPQCVEENERIDRTERALLLHRHLV